MNTNLKVSTVFEKNLEAYQKGYRVIMNQGGSRSTKSFSIMQLLITIALTEDVTISVTSCAYPHLRRGSLRDWRVIMENMDLYSPEQHVKTEQVYNYSKRSYIEFFSVDNNLKVRGPGRDILFINEANLIAFDTFQQLILRTRKTIFLDFNPADEFHWLYDHVQNRPDCYFIKSTYKDNPFLPIEQIREIENLKNVDANFWRIYGEGERGHSEGIIFTHWQPFTENVTGNTAYGLDFGYNHPAALIKTTDNDGNLYSEEVFCQSHLVTPELIDLIKQLTPKNAFIYCDTANPDKIKELRNAGINALPANKDVKDGILFIKSRKWFVKGASLIKELKSYKYKTIGETITEEPLKINDDCCDAARYSCTHFRKPIVRPTSGTW